MQHRLIKLKLRKKVKLEELNFIIVEDFLRKLQELKKVQNRYPLRAKNSLCTVATKESRVIKLMVNMKTRCSMPMS